MQGHVSNGQRFWPKYLGRYLIKVSLYINHAVHSLIHVFLDPPSLTHVQSFQPHMNHTTISSINRIIVWLSSCSGNFNTYEFPPDGKMSHVRH